MINRPLAKKFLIESVILFSFAAVAVFAFGWFRVWIVGELDTTQFKQIIDLLPEDWRKFSSVDFDWLVSYLGRTALTLDEPMLVLFVSLWAVIRGSDVVSGEISRGTMEMVLAQPISRRQIFVQHMAMTMGGCAILCLLIWLGMSIGIYTTSVDELKYPEIRIPIVDYRIPMTFLPANTETIAMSSQVSPVQFLPGIVNLFSLSVFLTCAAGFCSSWDRYRWRTLGIVIGFYFLNAMVKLAAMSSTSLAWMLRINFFGYYEPAPSIQLEQSSPGSFWKLIIYEESGSIAAFGPMTNTLVLIGLGCLLLFLGSRIFERRDIPAPI